MVEIWLTFGRGGPVCSSGSGPGPHGSAPPASVIRNGKQRTGRGGRAKENIF